MAEVMMDAPYRPTALDRPKGFGGQGVLGLGVDRVEGPAKVTGAAQYAVERAPAGTAHAAIVSAPVGSGEVTAIDAGAAEALPGVLAVIHGDSRMTSGGSNSQSIATQGGTRIFHRGQPVALVVAETAEVAREAARLVRVVVDETPGRYDFDAGTPKSDHGIGFLPNIAKGDLDAALAAAPVTLDLTYRTPIHFPAALEPHGSTAWWDGDQLTIRSSNQVIGAAKDDDRQGAGDRRGERARAGAVRRRRLRRQDRRRAGGDPGGDRGGEGSAGRSRCRCRARRPRRWSITAPTRCSASASAPGRTGG